MRTARRPQPGEVFAHPRFGPLQFASFYRVVNHTAKGKTRELWRVTNGKLSAIVEVIYPKGSP